MLDHVDSPRDLIVRTHRCYSLLIGWIRGFISNHSPDLVVSPFQRFTVIKGRKQHLISDAAMDPIAITSSDSDSDFDLDYYREKDTPLIGESASSSNPRVLPPWASMPKESPSGYGGRSQTFTFPKSTSTSNGRSSNSTQHPQPSGSSYDNRSSDRHFPRPNDYKLSKDKVISVTRPRDLDTQNIYGMHRSEQAGKRSLPSSLQPSVPMNNATNIVGTVGSSQIRDINGKSYHSEGTSFNNDKRFMNNQVSSDNDDDVIIYENSRSRILPPSLTHGKSISITQSASSSDRVHRAGFVEERDAETDERLIYQAALQDLNQPKLEATMPDGLLSVTLLRHQKIALAWMLQKETRSLHCLGGILADDQHPHFAYHSPSSGGETETSELLKEHFIKKLKGLGKTISMIALIQMQKFLQSKISSEDTNNHKAEALNLDDDDDNGMGDLEKVPKVEPSEEPDNIKPEVSTPTRAITRKRPAAGTLVVCPASVLRQWSRELDEKVADEAKLSVVIYHGGGRTKDPGELAKYDVVLTTYAIVTNEVPKQPVVDEEDTDDKIGVKHGFSEFSVSKKRKKTSTVSNKEKKGRKGIDNSSSDYGCGPLAKVGWLRVILDEAQTIKNHRTQVARACCSLRAKRRWCLSGTPIQNSIDDLYSYFRFLKYDPYADYKSFYSTIKIQISRNSVHGYKKLQAVLRAIMLRRTKGTFIDGEPIIKLPPKTICLNKVDFSPEERAFYSKLEADSRSQFKAYAAAGTLSQNYANILLMLLRLRQACDHPILVKGFNTESVGKESLEMAKSLPTDTLMNLLNLLETSLAICLMCNDPPEDAVVTKCGHVFCYQCVSEYLTGEDNMCPMPSCKKHLGPDIAFSKATLRSCLSSNDLNSRQPDPHQFVDNSIVLQNEYCSSKIKAVLETLQSECKVKSKIMELDGSTTCNGSSDMENKESTKAIVFSQWTSMLDLVEMSLKQTFLQYRRLDGTMSLASRDKAVRDFNTDPEVTVMIMSLKAGNLGLNMVAACHVILLDLWWNPTTEDQAIDRAHRIGQTRPVTVSRLTVKDTVEDRILALQEEKRKMVASAFGEDHGGGTATRLTVEDLRYLFMV